MTCSLSCLKNHQFVKQNFKSSNFKHLRAVQSELKVFQKSLISLISTSVSFARIAFFALKIKLQPKISISKKNNNEKKIKQYTIKNIKQLIKKRFFGFVTVQKNKRHIMQEQYEKNEKNNSAVVTASELFNKLITGN